MSLLKMIQYAYVIQKLAEFSSLLTQLNKKEDITPTFLFKVWNTERRK